jgi:hypothetical protein
MECENCVEILADFLLDELQESQAVLVQEHLNICPECMKAYRELKGTGKMLEKVPAMRQLTGTPEFNRAVRAGAAIESAKIISALPPERRVRLEARRAARHDKTASQRLFAARKKMFSTGLIVLAGIAVVTLIIFYPGSGGRHVELGTVKLVVGQVDASSGNQTQPAKDGKPVFLDDVYTTPKDGSARFELNDGSTLYVGPESKVSFRSPTEPSEGFTIRVDSGEIGVQRAALKQDSKDKSHGMRWSVQTELGSTRPEPETHLYLSAVPPKETAGASISVRVLTGNAIVLSRSGATSNLIGGSRYSESSGQGKGRLETDVDARVPKWRAEMLSEVELSSLLNGRVKIRSRQNEGIEVELVYSREAGRFQLQQPSRRRICASQRREPQACRHLPPAAVDGAVAQPRFEAGASVEFRRLLPYRRRGDGDRFQRCNASDQAARRDASLCSGARPQTAGYVRASDAGDITG